MHALIHQDITIGKSLWPRLTYKKERRLPDAVNSVLLKTAQKISNLYHSISSWVWDRRKGRSLPGHGGKVSTVYLWNKGGGSFYSVWMDAIELFLYRTLLFLESVELHCSH